MPKKTANLHVRLPQSEMTEAWEAEALYRKAMDPLGVADKSLSAYVRYALKFTAAHLKETST